MSILKFRLFGKFSVECDTQLIKNLDSGKEQELLSYLLVRRDRSHPRETLASLLWGDSSTEKSKKYLRQALWHLQSGLEVRGTNVPQLLLVQHDWVQLNSQSGLWLDVADFEKAFSTTQGVPGKQLDKTNAELLKEAVKLYRGDLLDGCYHDWCLFERERLQNMYLSMLDKLMSYCEQHQEYEEGLGYGSTILRYDRASERTYRRLMHLQYRAGDRTGALRQYRRCVTALHEELGVKPERRTRAVYDYIRADELDKDKLLGDEPAKTEALPEVLGRLKRLHLLLATVQKRLQRDIKAVEQGMKTLKH
ncbi:MAG TPA: bacterial transcriptional activator domain-containing protein [Pyrinomonadaceae bacterium]|jgi:DNA-binding SARP family transcriptional activator